jgi:hypothetical protein
LINQKYKQKRGFKMFGYSSIESISVLKELNDKDRSLSFKQDALQDYLDDVKCEEKRLFEIINQVKNMRPNAAAPMPALSQQKA